MNILELTIKTKTYEKRASQLEDLIGCLQRGELNEELSEKFPSLAKLQQQNERLQYRCKILEKVW